MSTFRKTSRPQAHYMSVVRLGVSSHRYSREAKRYYKVVEQGRCLPRSMSLVLIHVYVPHVSACFDHMPFHLVQYA